MSYRRFLTELPMFVSSMSGRGIGRPCFPGSRPRDLDARRTLGRTRAMRGAPIRAIQEVAGHRNLATTQRYLHLSPAAIQDAIRLLEGPNPVL